MSQISRIPTNPVPTTPGLFFPRHCERVRRSCSCRSFCAWRETWHLRGKWAPQLPRNDDLFVVTHSLILSWKGEFHIFIELHILIFSQNISRYVLSSSVFSIKAASNTFHMLCNFDPSKAPKQTTSAKKHGHLMDQTSKSPACTLAELLLHARTKGSK